jgi:hypothetical protein
MDCDAASAARRKRRVLMSQPHFSFNEDGYNSPVS